MRIISTICIAVLTLPSNLNAQCWQQIASSFDHVLAIHEDGSLWTWGGVFSGYRQNNYPVQIGEDTDWTSISAGYYTNAAIKSDGTLWMWGENGFGQLGQGTQTNLWTPTQVGEDNDWLQVSCGQYHTAAIKTDGTLWLWGRNNNGQMGAGLNRTNRLTPAQLGMDSDWVEVSAGQNHTLIRKSINAMWFVGACYSTSINSQLKQVGSSLDWKTMGGGAYTDYGIKQNGTLWKWVNSNGGPSGLTQFNTQTNWDKVCNSIGYSQEAHALFIKTNGTLWSFGTNNFGQLGTGTLNNVTDAPVQIGSDTDWEQAVAGALYSLALKTNHSLWVWGRNQHAQFGNGENKNQMRPIDGVEQWKTVATPSVSYNGHTLAIREDGTLWAWGPNQDGQLGTGTAAYVHKALPLQVGMDNNWKSVTNGFHFSIGIKEDGTIWGWGRNGNGQAGLGNAWSSLVPMQIGTDSTWVMAAASASNTIAIKEDGTLWGWGNNQFGELGTGNTTQSKTPIQIGSDDDWIYVASGNQHSLAIKEDGSLWTWGNNDNGQLGRSGSSNLPIQVGADSWAAVAGGGLHTLGIKSDSTLWAWGRNLYFQLGDGSTSNKFQPVLINGEHKWKSVSAGYEHSLALSTDSLIWGWGRNASGCLNDSTSYVQYLSPLETPQQIHPEHKWMTIAAGAVNSAFIDTAGALYTVGDSYVQDSQTNFPQLGYVYWTPQQINICNSCPSSSYSYSQSICAGDSVLFQGQYLHEAGLYYDTLVNAAGCDSLITFNLIVMEALHSIDIQIACESFEWIDGNTYFASNNSAIFTHENGASNGCDSIVHLNLTILQPVHFTDTQTACESFEWIDGNTYFASNDSAIFTYENGASNGCDSIVHLNLTILQPVHFTDIQTACESFEWIDGNTYFTSNDSAIFIYENGASNGCDSIVHLNLTILQSVHFTDIQTACESFEWIDGNTYFTSNDSAIFTYENGASNGCDSIVHLNLTILQPVHFTDTQTACESFEWIDGNTYFASNDSAIFIYENGASNGCDSIVHLNFTLHSIDNDVVVDGNVLSAASGALSYQWIDCNTEEPIDAANSSSFAPSVSGSYAVELSDELCTALSECYDIVISHTEELSGGINFRIYPNPSRGQVHLEFDGVADLEVLDVMGKCVYSARKITSQLMELNHLESGVYFFRLVQVGKSQMQRWILSVM